MTLDTMQPVPLVELVRRYAADCAAAIDPREAVAATVVRIAGFTNRGVVASGHTVEVDEPEAFGGSGTGPDPAELLLTAIGASLSVTLTAHAALGGSPLESIEVALAGEMDPLRFLQPDAAPGGGVLGLDLVVTLGTAMPPAAAQALLDAALLASPVVRSLALAPRARLVLK